MAAEVPEPTEITSDDLLADQPLGDIDLGDRSLDDLDDLNHRVVAQRMAEIVRQSPGRLNIALFGPWGSGKSSFFSLLKKRLDPKIGVVEFDAWKHSGSAFHRNFLSVFGRAVNGVGDRTDERLFQASRTVTLPLGLSLKTKRGFSLWWMLVPIILVVVFLAVPIGFTFLTLPSGQSFLSTLGANLAGWATFGATTTIAFVLVGLVLDFAKVNVQESAPSEIAQFGKIFDQLLVSDRRWVVFIDELDRCGSKEVVATLEGLRTFLNHPKVTFVVAFDRKSVASAIRKSADYETPRRPDAPYYSTAGEYIDKIFQYQISLPPQPAFTFRRLALTLTSKPEKGIWADIRSGQDEYERVVSLLSPAHLTSPRRTKVLLNDFAVNARIYESINPSWRSRLEEIAVLTVLQTEFPDFYGELEKRPEILSDVDPNAATEAAATILKEAGVAELETTLVAPTAEPGEEAEGEGRPDSSPVSEDHEVQTELQAQLSSYLTRIIQLGVQLPRADLVLMHSDGDLLSFDDSSIYNLVRAASRMDFDAAFGPTSNASDNDRLRSIEYLTEQLEIEGPLESRAIAALLGPLVRTLPAPESSRFHSALLSGWRLLTTDPRTTPRRVIGDYSHAMGRDATPAESAEFLDRALDLFGESDASFVGDYVDAVPAENWVERFEPLAPIFVRAARRAPGALKKFLEHADTDGVTVFDDELTEELSSAFTDEGPDEVKPETTTAIAKAEAVAENERLQAEWVDKQEESKQAFAPLVEDWEQLNVDGTSRHQILGMLLSINRSNSWAGELYAELADRDRQRGLGKEANDLMLLASTRDRLAVTTKWTSRIEPGSGASNELAWEVFSAKVRGLFTSRYAPSVRISLAEEAVSISSLLSDSVDPSALAASLEPLIAKLPASSESDLVAQEQAVFGMLRKLGASTDIARVQGARLASSIVAAQETQTFEDFAPALAALSVEGARTLRDVLTDSLPDTAGESEEYIAKNLLEIIHVLQVLGDEPELISSSVIASVIATDPDSQVISAWIRTGPPAMDLMAQFDSIDALDADWSEYSSLAQPGDRMAIWRALVDESVRTSKLRQVAQGGIAESLYVELGDRILEKVAIARRADDLALFRTLPQGNEASGTVAAKVALSLIEEGMKNTAEIIAEVLWLNRESLSAAARRRLSAVLPSWEVEMGKSLSRGAREKLRATRFAAPSRNLIDRILNR